MKTAKEFKEYSVELFDRLSDLSMDHLESIGDAVISLANEMRLKEAPFCHMADFMYTASVQINDAFYKFVSILKQLEIFLEAEDQELEERFLNIKTKND